MRTDRFALVADLGGTKIAAARVSNGGIITHQVHAPTPAAGGARVVETIVKLLQQLPREGAFAAGVAVPGLVRADGTVWAPNLRGWKRMPLAAQMRRRLHLPVVVESDRNACVLGEQWKGSAQNRRDLVFVAIGTGIGAGIISGGHLVRGHGELSGCVGWLPVRERFLPQYKGSGCLEFHAAGPGIAHAGGRIFGRPISSEEIVALARTGDSRARQILEEAGRLLGGAMAAMVDILNPQIIIVGGGLAAAGNLLLASARRSMRQWAQPLAARQVRVVRSQLGNRAPLLGIARLSFEQDQR